MKFSIGVDPVHQVEILPGVLVTLMAWFVLNFTMGFTGVGWPIWLYILAIIVVCVIIAYNITVDNKCLIDAILGEGFVLA